MPPIKKNYIHIKLIYVLNNLKIIFRLFKKVNQIENEINFTIQLVGPIRI